METYSIQNGKMVKDANGMFAQVPEGQIQKGDMVLYQTSFSKSIQIISKVTAKFGKTENTNFLKNIINGCVELDEFPAIAYKAFVFRKIA